MTTEFRYAPGRFRGQILGWGIGLALLGALLGSMYDSFAAQQEQFQQLLDFYPPEIAGFFGDLNAMFTSPEAFVSVEFFSYMPLVLGIFVVLIGSGLLVADEENGTLDLILSYPIRRVSLFAGRLLAFAVATVAILAIAWLGLAAPALWSSMGLEWGQLGLPLLSLLGVLLLFGTLSLLLSLLLPSRRTAAMTGGVLLVASFFVTGLANMNEDLESVAKLSPLSYYQTLDAFESMNGEWLAGLLVAAAVFAALSRWFFQRRDIRVGGEGGWRLPWRRR